MYFFEDVPVASSLHSMRNCPGSLPERARG
jgi:hypothetical protein